MGFAEQALAEKAEGSDALSEAIDLCKELLKNGSV